MKKKLFNTIIATAVLTALSASVAYAGTWRQNGNQWSYDNGDGTSLKNGWYWLDGNYDGSAECYYFDANGVMASDETVQGYQVNSDGAWISNGQVQTKSSVSPGTSLLHLYENVEKLSGIISDDIVDCGSYYELRNFTIEYVEVDGIYGTPAWVDTNETVYLRKDANIEWKAGENWQVVAHYTPKGYGEKFGLTTTTLSVIRLFVLKFDANGWIVGGYDIDAN